MLNREAIIGMLIGFSGACNSGKTTLANALAEELRRRGYKVELVGEVVRVVFKEFQSKYGFKDLRELRESRYHFQFQFEVLKTQIERENSALTRAEIVLSDRTVYDNLFYTIFWNSMDWRTLREYVSLFKSLGNRRYDIIFFCKPLRNNSKDGFRDYDLNYVEIQDLVIRLFIERENVIDVPEADLNERLKFCLRNLEQII